MVWVDDVPNDVKQSPSANAKYELNISASLSSFICTVFAKMKSTLRFCVCFVRLPVVSIPHARQETMAGLVLAGIRHCEYQASKAQVK